MRSRVIPATLFVIALLLAAVAASSAVAPRSLHKKATKHKKAAKHKKALPGPVLQAPRDDASTASVPSFTWARVKGAATYEFQLSADGAFRSSVFSRTHGSLQTRNTAATISTTLADGDYFWRVRAVSTSGAAGRWSRTRTLHKLWSDAPALLTPVQGATANYPSPLVLSWSSVPRAFKYQVQVATDPGLGSPADGFSKPIETSATQFAVGLALPVGQYYWAVTPLDADKHKGARSAVGSFQIDWPSTTATRVTDLAADARVYDPQFSWDPVPGAARYEVELNSSSDFAAGSKVCCSDPTTGTSLSPKKVLPNNTGAGGGYFWRMRAIDVDGNAGVWNAGPSFPKYFSPTDIPSVPNLHMRDHVNDLPQGGIPRVGYPVVAWDPAPGASSYEVEVAPVSPLATTFTSAAGTSVSVAATAHMVAPSTIRFANGDERQITSIAGSTEVVVDSPLSSTPAPGSTVTTSGGLCNWTSDVWDGTTATTAWTPLGGRPKDWPVGLIATGFPDGPAFAPGASYCVRVRARGDRDAQNHDVVSAWTELGDFLNRVPSFEYAPPPAPTCAAGTTTQASDYLTPASGQVDPRMPFFAWQPVAGACSYFVVVARDASFTDVVDIAFTRDPDYAPRRGASAQTYTDESSSYYWAVIPAPNTSGDGVWSMPEDNAPQEFHKRSIPPTPLTPVGGADVTRQPTFSWTAAEGARQYHLQVAQDPSFANPIDDVTTDATAFTSSSTYPADSTLYWRVRANDERAVGLSWSDVQTFKRRLPAPQPDAGNPTGGRTIPLLSWTPVEGAISYDVHIDQPDGTQKDFNMRTPSFTPTTHYGTGVWQWKVRANFPKMPFGGTPGAYSASGPFTRFIGSPAGARGVASSTRILLAWDPVEMAKSYRVEISKTNGFTSTIDSQTTDNTSYAPGLTNAAFGDGGKLYWRVASIDEGNTLGGWTTGTFSLPKRIKVAVKGSLRRGRKGAVRVKITDTHGHSVRKALVRVKGAGAVVHAKRTSRRGTTLFKLRPHRSGKITIQATKGGYRAGSAVLTVMR